MMNPIGFPTEILPVYLLATTVLGVLIGEAFIYRRKRAWSIPAIAVYATVGAWYFVEPIYTPENLVQFSPLTLENCFWQVIVCLVSFRLLLTPLSLKFLKNYQVVWKSAAYSPERLLIILSVGWLCLLGYGITRLNGDVINALFPIAGRSGAQMWGRAAAAGGNAFVVASAAYVYALVCAFFGVLLPLPMKKAFKALNICLFAVVLPYFIFMGARNQLLAIVLPAYFSYALFHRDKLWKKALISLVTFAIVNQMMTMIIGYRSTGFESILTQGAQLSAQNSTETKHLGLNMLEELCHINQFYQAGLLKLTYGSRYLAELANVVPRAIWANKPLIGIDYAILRGFGGANNSIGVFATVATGLIGQGFYNFGPLLGPAAAGALMAGWVSFMSRLWLQRFSMLRLGLFLVCLGLTFNLGREFSLLVLWPAVFGYVIVRCLEYRGQQRRGNYKTQAAKALYIRKIAEL